MRMPRPLRKAFGACSSCNRLTTAALFHASCKNGRFVRELAGQRIRPSMLQRIRFGPYASPDNKRHAYSTAAVSRGCLRVAIVGSGPAGFYVAYRLLNKVHNATIDMYEQLPVPYGLVRFGVAPDHPEVKNCQTTFEEAAQSPRFTYIGNVRVGHDISLSQMKPHYDAILFSYGAVEDKRLNISGEELPEVHSAREFVGWYNGLPQFHNLEPRLDTGDQAVVIGQGNVALDVARILLTPVDMLRHTDITEQAIQKLSESKIKSVRVVGRRGPLQAAFTVKEARELMHIPSVAFEPIDKPLYPDEINRLPRVQKRIGLVLLKGTESTSQNASRKWALEFLKAPKSINASSGHVSSATFTNQRFWPGSDPHDKNARVEATDQTSSLEASLVFRSVGYKSVAIPGLSDLGVPFDTNFGIIPNDLYGRVISPSLGPGDLSAGHVPGLYCAGWVKRGPTGVIASTMDDAFTSADIIAQDWNSNVPFLNHVANDMDQSTSQGWHGIKKEVIKKGVRPLSWQDWKRIDEAEKERGRKIGKVREKFASVEEMLRVLDS